MQAIEVRVWDPLIRVVHWLLAAAVLIDWATDEPCWMHVWLGYLAGALVILRIVWGFVGPENARFGSFVRAPRAVFDYLAGLIRFSSKRYLGHSPAGGAMIVALLIMIAATVVTGMANLAADQGTGPLSGRPPVRARLLPAGRLRRRHRNGRPADRRQLGLLWEDVDFEANVIHIRRMQERDGSITNLTKTVAGTKIGGKPAVSQHE